MYERVLELFLNRKQNFIEAVLCEINWNRCGIVLLVLRLTRIPPSSLWNQKSTPVLSNILIKYLPPTLFQIFHNPHRPEVVQVDYQLYSVSSSSKLKYQWWRLLLVSGNRSLVSVLKELWRQIPQYSWWRHKWWYWVCNGCQRRRMVTRNFAYVQELSACYTSNTSTHQCHPIQTHH